MSIAEAVNFVSPDWYSCAPDMILDMRLRNQFTVIDMDAVRYHF
jgi:hypothetical protein